MATTHSTSLRVAVIGGGAAGLSAARVLSRAGLTPLVLEKDAQAGGVWRYKDEHEHGKTKKKKHPMYRGLRTNLPREIMAYREKPWGSSTGNISEGRSYVTHQEVLQYLEDYKQQFDLDRYIHYGATVTQLKVLHEENSSVTLRDEEMPRLELQWTQGDQTRCQTFDAVCVANGHYAKPAFAPIEGIHYFKGNQLHSIEYDDPSLFQGQTVLCIGGRASGSDLAREISHFADQVYLSDTTCNSKQQCQKVTWLPKTQRVHSDGSIEFHGESQRVHVDTIIFCTGYDYEFPFITPQSNLPLSYLPGERRVQPLYKQLWHAQFPNLAFLGLPHSVVPFPLFELQSEAFVHSLIHTQTNNLPCLSERMLAAQQDAQTGGPNNHGRIQDTHYLGAAQWDYCLEMARMANNLTEDMQNYIATNQAIYDHAGVERKSLFPGGLDTYRSTCYKRDDANQSFQVIATEMTSPKPLSTNTY